MLKNFFLTFFTFFSSLFAVAFGIKRNKALYLSGRNLLNRSFRLPEKEARNFFVVIRMSLSALKKMAVSPYSQRYLANGEFIFDIDSGSKTLREQYIRHFNGSAPEQFIAKESLLNEISFLQKTVIGFFLLLTLPFFFVITLFFQNKSPFSLLFAEILENAVLVTLAERFKLTRCYFFSIYEKDANIAALLLQKKNVEVIKIPSEVPFYFFNTTIVCDTLVICNAYQLDELKRYRQSLVFKNYRIWGPERITDFYSIYREKSFSIKRKTVAFYSTASWVRLKEGHMDQGVNMSKNEKLLLGYLKEYLETRKEISLMIYPHPKEKTEKYFSQTKEYYSELFRGVPFEFARLNEASAKTFFNAELAVAFNSTLVYERLYCGFKTLILPLDHTGFPIETSGLKNICAYSREELFEKMDRSFTQDEVNFFRQNKLGDYVFAGEQTVDNYMPLHS